MKKIPEGTAPCRICGEETDYLGDKLCDNCWEVMHRFDWFIRSKKAKEWIFNKMKGWKNIENEKSQ